MATALASVSPALCDPVADFYRGKQVSLVLSTGAGGGYASYAHAFAPYLSKHIPGNPTIVVQNLPGAGGLRAMQYFASVAPRDGSVLGLVHSSVPFAPLYGIKGATFDPRAMNWLGSINSSEAICVSWAASGVTQWMDLFDKTYIVGGTGAGSQMETMPDAINRIFGTKIKIISGYSGGNEVYLAMERGEVQGRCGVSVSSVNSTRSDWFPSHMVEVPIVIGMHRTPLFPDIPALAEFVPDKRTRDILDVLLAYQDMDRPLLVPPGTPPARLEMLRKAFHQGMNDPDFIAEAKRIKLEIDEITGQRLEEVLANAFMLPADVVQAAKDAMSMGGQTK